MAGTASVSGLISGIKTDDIITKVMDLARRPQKMAEVQKAKDQLALAQWQDMNVRVLALQTRCDNIATTSAFLTRSATSSDEKVATATASANALPGIYDIKVTSRAQSHQIASQTYGSMQDDIGTGSLSVAFSNGDSFKVTVDENNNTLIGLRDSINRASEGVTATIVNQGTEAVPAFRLMMTSENTGTDYKMTTTTDGINVVLDQEVQTAKNAVVTLGSGANAITVSKASNTIADLIPGVTLNVVKADTENSITIQVAKDTATIKTAIQDFVTQFNDVAGAMNEQSVYDAEAADTPSLFGNYQLQNMQNELISMVTGSVAGLTGEYSSLSSIGITLGNDGLLAVNSSELQSALDNHQTEVSKLFGADLDSDNALVRYAASTSDTKTSGARGWEVDITQPAIRAQVTAGKAMAAPLANDEFLMISGNKLSLTKGMTIDQVIATINGKTSDTALSAFKAGADGTGTGNYISLRSNYYGSRYSFSISSNMPMSSTSTSGFGIILMSPDNPTGESGEGKGQIGLDVAGTINGDETTGTGQVLTANPASSSSSTKGFSVLTTTTSPLTTHVRFTKGIGAAMQDLVGRLTSSTGTFATAQTSLNSSIDATTKNIADMETRLVAQQDRLAEQYTKMESALAKLQDQSSSLTALTANNTSN